MKNKILFLLAAISVLTISSCKKKIETCKLGKSYLSDGNTTPNPSIFYYYSDGKLKKIVYPDAKKDTLAYSGDSIFITAFDKTGSTASIFSGVLNGSSYLTNGTKTTFDISGNTVSSEDYTMLYNAEGNLIQQAVSYSTSTDILQYYFSGGNADSAVAYIGNIRDKKYIFYRNSAENKSRIDDLRGVFTPYFGKASKNLLDSVRIYSSPADTALTIYAHTLDNNDYVTKTIETFLYPDVNTKYYTYQYFDCNE